MQIVNTARNQSKIQALEKFYNIGVREFQIEKPILLQGNFTYTKHVDYK